MHQFIIKEPSFPTDPKEAIRRGFEKTEESFKSEVYTPGEPLKDKSGSCAIVILIVGQNCYVGNVGDSRAILSSHSGLKLHALSRDHKPSDELEKERITEAGG